MKKSKLGTLEVGRIGLGAMGMSAYYTMGEGSEAESIRTIHRAIDLGATLIDTAEVYGPYTNEELVGKALKGKREKVVLATKFGVISHLNGGINALDSKPDNIRIAVEGSLKRLQTDYIDLYYQHRVDPKTPIEDTVGALAQLVKEGKIRHIGLSEAGTSTIERAHGVHPITALQSEYSLCSGIWSVKYCHCCASLVLAWCLIRLWAVVSSRARLNLWIRSPMTTGVKPIRGSVVRTFQQTFRSCRK